MQAQRRDGQRSAVARERPTPQCVSRRSPASRANDHRNRDTTTTAPAATVALAASGPARKHGAPVHRRRLDEHARRTSGTPAARARRAAREVSGVDVGRRPRQEPRNVDRDEHERAPQRRPETATRGEIATAAAPAAIPDPARSPKLHMPCSTERIGRPMRASSATPCAFAETSAIPHPTPRTQTAGTSVANDGANAAPVSPAQARRVREQSAPDCRSEQRASRRPGAAGSPSA